MPVNIYKDSNELTAALASWIVDYIKETLTHSPRFTIALSGGNTPKELYLKLASEPYVEKINWAKVHVFWGDERVVPFTDQRNNANMAFNDFLNKVPVPSSHIHIIRTDIQIDHAVLEYDRKLKMYFSDHHSSFDLVLLGLGEDGHTLSLFPNANIITESGAWVGSVSLPDQDMKRISLMPEIVNKARRVAFMVTGKAKANILEQVLHGEIYYPAKKIQPESGGLYWFLDQEAAIILKDHSSGL